MAVPVTPVPETVSVYEPGPKPEPLMVTGNVSAPRPTPFGARLLTLSGVLAMTVKLCKTGVAAP